MGKILKECLGNFKEGERVIAMAPQIAREGDTARDGITCVYRVHEVNDRKYFLQTDGYS